MRMLPIVALLSLTACFAASEEEDDDALADDALVAGPKVTMTKAGLVGSYFQPRSACTRFGSLTLSADGTYESKACGPVPSTTEKGTWTNTSRSITLKSSAGVTTKYVAKRGAQFVEEPALAVLDLSVGGGAPFRVAKRMPVDAILGTVNVGESREFRYEQGTRSGSIAYSLSAVVIHAKPSERVTVRVEADRPLMAGSSLGADWHATYPYGAEYIEYYRSPSGGLVLGASSVHTMHLAPSSSDRLISFGATSGPDSGGDAGVHLRISVSSDEAPAAAAPPSFGGAIPVTASTFQTSSRLYGQSATIALTPLATGETTFRLENPSCIGSRPIAFPLTPDGAGGFSGVAKGLQNGYAYASVRKVDGRWAVHTELFDNFIQGSPHPYLNATSCTTVLQGYLP